MCSWNSCILQPWAWAKTLKLWRFILYAWLLLLHACTISPHVFVEVTDPSSSRWHTGKGLFLVCVENSIKLESAGCIPGSSQLALRKSWIYMLWFDQIGILAYQHASALTITLACSLHRQAAELKVIHTCRHTAETYSKVSFSVCVCIFFLKSLMK